MITQIKKLARQILGLKTETDFYGQAGEDAILLSIICNVLKLGKGRYMDIGAYHPFRHSNTYILYKAGWTGINVDPRPGFKSLFDKHRPSDLNIEAGVAAKNGHLNYYILDKDSTMNSFSEENLIKLNLLSKVKQMLSVPVFTIQNILEKYSIGERIDYLNIDAEGFELEILSGMNFGDLDPRLISIEQNTVTTLDSVSNTDVYRFLSARGYRPIAKNVILENVATVFYLKVE